MLVLVHEQDRVRPEGRAQDLVGVARVRDDDELLMITARGKLQRIPCADISIIGRNTQGVKIINLSQEGEQVVVSANFLIDSESQMKAAASGMGGMAGMPGMTNEPAKPEVPANKPKAAPGKPDSKAMDDMPGMGTKKK